MGEIIDFPTLPKNHTIDDLIKYLQECKDLFGGELPFFFLFDAQNDERGYQLNNVIEAEQLDTKTRVILGVLE